MAVPARAEHVAGQGGRGGRPRVGAVFGDAIVIEVAATDDEGAAPSDRQEHDGAPRERADADDDLGRHR